MLNKNEYKLLEDSCFTIIRKELQFVEFKSNTTGYYWSVFSNQFDLDNRITVYHKKAFQNANYAECSEARDVSQAIYLIKEYDKQDIKLREYNKRNESIHTTRRLRVHEGSGYKHKPTPTIILKGDWLRKCGFDFDDEIEVMCDNIGELTIRKIA